MALISGLVPVLNQPIVVLTVVVPNAPTGLTAADTNSTSTQLSWQAASIPGLGTVSDYIVYENGTALTTTAATSYAVTGLSPYTDYSFTVAAVDSAGTSAQSTADTLTTAPEAPPSLTATGTTNSSTTLNWSPETVTPIAGLRPTVLSETFLIYEGGTLIGTTGVDTFTVNQLPAAANVTFSVVGQNNTGNSPPSTITVTTPAGALSAPTGVAASGTSSSTTKLTWTAPAGSVTGYAIYLNGGLIGSTAGTSYLVTGLNGSTKYSLDVVAETAQGDSPPSTAVSVTTPAAVVSTPQDLTAGNTASSGTSLSWQAASVSGGGAVADYLIYQNGVQIGTSTATNYVVTGLAGNTTYDFTVAAADAAGDTATSAALAVTTAVAVPNAPQSLSATTTSSGFTLSWQAPPAPSGGDFLAYNVYENGQLVDQLTDATSYTQTTLPAATTYNFSVTAEDIVGESPPATLAVTTAAGVLNAPTALAAASTASGAVKLTWQAPSVPGGGAVSGYVIYQNGAQVGTSATNSYLANNLTAATSYAFSVFAEDAAGDSVLSAPLSVTTAAAALAAPGSLTAASVASEGVTLAWQSPTIPAGATITDYVIYANGAEVGTSTATNFNVSPLTPLTTYSFAVAAEAGTAASALSAPLSVTTVASTAHRDGGDGGGGDGGGGGGDGGGGSGGGDGGGGGESNATVVPDAPTGLAAANTTTSSTSLTWQAAAVPGSGSVTDYLVYQNGAQIGSTSGTSYTVTGLSPSTSYSYTVIAEDAAGTSAAASPLSVTTALATPNAPSGLAASGTTSAGTSLAWQAAGIPGGGTVTGYVIYENGSQLATTSATNYTVSGLTGSTGYRFSVAAQDAAGNSAQSAPISVTTALAVPNAPTGLAASGTTSSTTSLAWQAASIAGGGALTGYVVYENGSQIGTTSATSYTVSGLSAATGYSFAVAAQDAAGASSPSPPISVTTQTGLPGAPSLLTASGTTANSTTLTWSAVTLPGATVSGYAIYENGTEVASATTTSTTITGLSGGTTYQFSVAAEDAAGQSPQSPTITVSTSAPVPNAPTGLTLRGTTSQGTTLSWQAAGVPGGGTVTGYVVYENGTLLADSATNSYSVTGLSPATAYSFTVAAVDTAGASAPSSAISVTTAPPAATTSTGNSGTTGTTQTGTTQTGTTQTGTTQTGSTQTGSTQTGTTQTGTTQTGTTQTGTTQTGTTQIGSTQTGTTQTGTTQIGSTQTGTTQTGSTQTGTTQTGTTQTGSTQTGSTQTGTTQTGSTQTGSTQTGSTQTGSTQTGSTQTGNTQTGTSGSAAALAISGTQSSQTVNDNATLVPFATAEVSDPTAGQTETLTVTLSAAANGSLSNLGNGTYNASTGVYSDTGSGSAVSQDLQSLIFTPTAHQAPPGQSVTTTFTLTDTDSAGATASATSSVVATAVAAAENDVTITRTANGDTYVAGNQSDSITTTAGTTNTITLGSGQDTVTSAGTDTIIGGSGAATISASAGAVVFSDGPLTFINGAGTSVIVAGSEASVSGGAGAVKVYGGADTLVVTGGTLGGNALVAGSGNATLTGGGNNDIFVGGAAGTTDAMTTVGVSAVFGGAANIVLSGGPAEVIAVGGSGSMAITNGPGFNALFGGTGQTTVNETTGNDYIVGGSGNIIVNQASALDWTVLGKGNITLNEGAGADIISLFDGQAGGTLTVSGFRPGTDEIYLSGYTSSAQASAIEGATTSGGSTTLSFSDGTHIVFMGASSVSSNVFA